MEPMIVESATVAKFNDIAKISNIWCRNHTMKYIFENEINAARRNL